MSTLFALTRFFGVLHLGLATATQREPEKEIAQAQQLSSGPL